MTVTLFTEDKMQMLSGVVSVTLMQYRCLLNNKHTGDPL